MSIERMFAKDLIFRDQCLSIGQLLKLFLLHRNLHCQLCNQIPLSRLSINDKAMPHLNIWFFKKLRKINIKLKRPTLSTICCCYHQKTMFFPLLFREGGGKGEGERDIV